jgi:hypothetical protein
MAVWHSGLLIQVSLEKAIQMLHSAQENESIRPIGMAKFKKVL